MANVLDHFRSEYMRYVLCVYAEVTEYFPFSSFRSVAGDTFFVRLRLRLFIDRSGRKLLRIHFRV